MRQWRGYPLTDGLGAHAEAWDALNRAQFNSHPLLDSRFWDGLLRHFGVAGVQLWVLQGDNGPLAMCLLQHQGWGRWTTYLPSQAQLGPVMVRDSTMVEELLPSLRPLAMQLDLLAIDPDVCTLKPLPGRQVRIAPHAMTMNVSVDGTFETYWEARAAGLKKNVRRYEKLTGEAGLTLRHQVVTAPEAVKQAVLRYATVESKGWKGAKGTALAPGNEQTRFYTDWLCSAAADGDASVYELWSGEQLVASRLVIRGGGMAVILKTTFDEAFAKCSPSWQLLRLLLAQAFSDGRVRLIEFYTNAHHGQLPWASGTRVIRHLSYFREGLAGTALHAVQTWRRVLAASRSTARQDVDGALTVTCQPLSEAWPKDVRLLFERAETLTQCLEISQPWYENLHRTVYSQHPGALLWVLRQNGQAMAALPVLVDPVGRGHRLTALSNFYTALFAPTVAPNLRPQALAVLLRQLMQHYRALGQLTFEPMDPHADGFHQLLSALELAGLVCFKFFRFGNWCLPGQTGYAQYLKARSANLRSQIKRMNKRCREAGARIEIVTEPDQLPDAMAAYWQVYRASWKQDEPFPDFIDGLTEWTAARGFLRLGLLWMNDQPIAAQLWLVAHGKCEIVKVAYDEALKELSPGTVLTAALLEQVLDRDGVTEVDFLIGDDAYKRNWMSDRRERWGIVAFNPATLVGLAGVLAQQLAEISRRWRRQAVAGQEAPCR